MKTKLINHRHSYAVLSDNKLIAFAHPEDFSNEHTIGKLSLKNCQAIERGYDLDELSQKQVEKQDPDWELEYSGTISTYKDFYKTGFHKALEILGDKKFSEGDVKLAIQFGSEDYEPQLDGRTERFIQSLQQTEWEVTIETEEILGDAGILAISFGEPDIKPKLDTEGCLILKRV